MFKIIKLVSSKYYFLLLFNVYITFYTQEQKVLKSLFVLQTLYLFFGQWNKISFIRHLIVEISSQIITLIKKWIKNIFLKSTHAKLNVESIKKVCNKFGQETVSNCCLTTLLKNKGH